jgi:phage N-6-adenine-methyltransferase
MGAVMTAPDAPAAQPTANLPEVLSPAEIAAEEQFLAEAESRIRSHRKRAADAIVEVGRELASVKARFGEHRDGRYTEFVTKRLGWSLDSATRFMNVFKLSQSPQIADFSGLTIDASSLYLIAAPSTPEPVREAVLGKAATPEGISHEEVKAAVAAGKPPAPKPAFTIGEHGEIIRPMTPENWLAPAAPPPAESRDEWYTPPTILDPARKVLGHFHLDPASCDLAQEKVKARRYFTKAEDGLAQDWIAESVWLNPPYSQPRLANFIAKLLTEYRAGRVKSAILLVNNGTCAAWFHDAAAAASALCFPRGRIAFYGPDGEAGDAGPRQGQALFYYGKNVAAFARRFGELGFVVYPAAPVAAVEAAPPTDTPTVGKPYPGCNKKSGVCGYPTCSKENRCLFPVPQSAAVH